jgi:hypothetical protein
VTEPVRRSAVSTIHVPLSQGYAIGAWEGQEDLEFRLPHTTAPVRHVVHYIDEHGTARRDPGGPELPGPYAFLTPRVVIPDPLPPSHRLTPDDLVEIGGRTFKPRADVYFVVLDLLPERLPAHS